MGRKMYYLEGRAFLGGQGLKDFHMGEVIHISNAILIYQCSNCGSAGGGGILK